MRQAAAPAAAIAAGSDVAALAAVLQEFGRDQQVKAETVQKLDDLLQQDPGLKDPEILRQTYRQFGIEANKKDLKIFRLEQLVNPQQIRALTLWPLLDSQMLPEYQRWCGLFPGNTKQGQISSDFHELKRLLPQFPSLDMVVGKEVESQWWSLFTNIKISGPEFARQLIDPNSLFASDVVCQTSGERMTKVEKELQQVRQRQVLAQNSELDQQNYYWSDLKTYLQEWSALDAPKLANLGIYHPLFVPQGSVGQGGVNLSSEEWESWLNIVEGLPKAINVVRSLMNVQQILNRLPSPNHCSQKYSELLTFLDLLCRKPQYEPYFQPLNQFLKEALQPASISVSESDLWLKAIGYILKPIVGVLVVGIALIVVLNVIVRVIFLIIFGILKGWVVVLLYGVVLVSILGILGAVIWPEIQYTFGQSQPGSDGWRSRTEDLLINLKRLTDQDTKPWKRFLRESTNFLTDVFDQFTGYTTNSTINEYRSDIYKCIQAEIEDYKEEIQQKISNQTWDTVKSKYRVLIRLECLAIFILILAQHPKSQGRNAVDEFLKGLGDYAKTLKLDANTLDSLNKITLSTVEEFSTKLRGSLSMRDNKSRECLGKLDRYLTAHLLTGLLENRITPNIFLEWVGAKKLIPPEALLRVLEFDRSVHVSYSRIWKPLYSKYTAPGMSSDDISKQGYSLIEQAMRSLSQATIHNNEISDKLNALADIFYQISTLGNFSVTDILQQVVLEQPKTTLESNLSQKLIESLSNLPPVPLPQVRSSKTTGAGNIPQTKVPSSRTKTTGATPITGNTPSPRFNVPGNNNTVPARKSKNSRQLPWGLVGALVAALLSVALAFALHQLTSNTGTTTQQQTRAPESQSSASTSQNRDTFLKIQEDLKFPTDAADDATLAEKIAQQLGEEPVEPDANTPPIQDSLLQLWSNPDDPDSWSQDNQTVLSEGVKALQKNSGLEDAKVTGTLTPEDPLYRLIKRRTSRDVAIASPTDPQVTRKEPLTTTLGSLNVLINNIARNCKHENNKNQLIDALKREITGNQNNELNWAGITQLDTLEMEAFEKAIVLYKYPIESTSGTSTDPQPTLIKGQDDPDLYDLELGIRQQIKCWDGLSDPPPEG